MHILLISPHAPPKNTAEGLQTGRFLSELDSLAKITLITTTSSDGEVVDSSNNPKLQNTEVITLRRPYSKAIQRFVESRPCRRLIPPDPDFWLSFVAPDVIDKTISDPDIIYSRSSPFSSALLAQKLQKEFRVPWIMHLSDPWADSPYRNIHGLLKTKDSHLESGCFQAAQAISVTTTGLAKFYTKKYPDLANKIFVVPNVMPRAVERSYCQNNDGILKILYAGSLYRLRRPTDILEAILRISKSSAKIAKKISVSFYGGITREILDEISKYNLPQVSLGNRISYSEVLLKQSAADILLSLEPDGSHPLLPTFLPSKVLDYISAKKPILAITPEGSETWNLCKRGYGWAFRPGDSEGVASLLHELSLRISSSEPLIDKYPSIPEEYTVSKATMVLFNKAKLLVNSNGSAVKAKF